MVCIRSLARFVTTSPSGRPAEEGCIDKFVPQFRVIERAFSACTERTLQRPQQNLFVGVNARSVKESLEISVKVCAEMALALGDTLGNLRIGP